VGLFMRQNNISDEPKAIEVSPLQSSPIVEAHRRPLLTGQFAGHFLRRDILLFLNIPDQGLHPPVLFASW
jgi:hypothetical protein